MLKVSQHVLPISIGFWLLADLADVLTTLAALHVPGVVESNELMLVGGHLAWSHIIFLKAAGALGVGFGAWMLKLGLNDSIASIPFWLMGWRTWLVAMGNFFLLVSLLK